jgi:hypothetical protein
MDSILQLIVRCPLFGVVKSVALLLALLFAPLTLGQEQEVAERPASDIRAAADDVQRVLVGEAEAASTNNAQRIIKEGRENSQVMAHLDYMVNRIGPRLTGSDNLTNACEWAVDAFEKFGLTNVHLDKWAEWPVGFNRGPWSGKMVSPEEIWLEFATNSWTAGTKGKQRGPAMLAPKNDDELAALKDQMAGKWILAGVQPGRRRGDRGNRGERGAREGGRGEEARGDRLGENGRPDTQAGEQQEERRRDRQQADNQGDQQAEAQPSGDQTAAVQAGNGERGDRQPGGRRGRRGRGGRQVVDPFQQKLRSVYQEVGVLGTITRSSSELIVTGGRRPTSMEFFDEPLPPAQILMAPASYEAIEKRVAAGEEVTLEFDIRNYFKKGPIPIYNVIADIPGIEWPNEYVIVGGHLDSWDAATGTTDNGTGCATTMEAARILMAAGVKPKRTIRFMLWTGEEQGLLGSEAYVRDNPRLMERISAVFVHDAGTQFISGISGLPTQMDDLKQVFAPVVALDPEFPFEVRVTNALRSGGSDHTPFIRAGVSGFFWSQSGDLARYRDTHHTTLDTYDRAVPSYQKHSSIVVALAAYGVANLDHMLPQPEEE